MDQLKEIESLIKSHSTELKEMKTLLELKNDELEKLQLKRKQIIQDIDNKKYMDSYQLFIKSKIRGYIHDDPWSGEYVIFFKQTPNNVYVKGISTGTEIKLIFHEGKYFDCLDGWRQLYFVHNGDYVRLKSGDNRFELLLIKTQITA